MQLRNTIFAALTLALAFCWTCESETNAPLPSDNTEGFSSICEYKTPHEIAAVDAQAYMDKYQAYISEVSMALEKFDGLKYPDPGKRLVYGAKVDRAELLEILLKSEKGDSLFIMMGIMNTDSTELVFAVDCKAENNWKFFDFTQPCPTACPSFAIAAEGKD